MKPSDTRLVQFRYPLPSGRDPEMTGLPGTRPAVGFHGSGRGAVLDFSWLAGAKRVWCRRRKRPKRRAVLACGTASERPTRVTSRGPLDRGCRN